MSNDVGFGLVTEDIQAAFSSPADANLIVDKWAHIMAVRNSTNIYVYLNGKKIGQKSISEKMKNRSHSFTIGSIESRGFHFAKGLIDDVRLYNRALSEEQVKALYDLEKPKGK